MSRDAYELLRMKEVDVARIRREVESLRLVIPLLDEEAAQPTPDEEAFSTPIETETEATAPGWDDARPTSRFWGFGRKREAKT